MVDAQKNAIDILTQLINLAGYWIGYIFSTLFSKFVDFLVSFTQRTNALVWALIILLFFVVVTIWRKFVFRGLG